MLETYWLEGYKITARSLSQALAALEQLKRSGAKPDYKQPAEGLGACYPNDMKECA